MLRRHFWDSWLRAVATTEDKRDIFRRQISFGIRGSILSVTKDPHENSLRISMQNAFKPARYNTDNGEGQ